MKACAHKESYIQHSKYEYFTPDICDEDNIAMVVLIHSAVNNIKKRNIIRESWGTSQLEDGAIKLVFLVAGTDDVQSQKMVSCY